LIMATKTTSERKIWTATVRGRQNQGDWYVIVPSYTALDRTLVSSFQGVENPDWWRQVRYGQQATTDASGTETSITISPYHAFLAFGQPGASEEISEEGDLHANLLTEPPTLAGFPGLSDSVRNTVLVRFLNKCVGVQRKFMSGVIVGELHKTIQLIRHPLKALENAIYEYAVAVRGRSRYLSPRQIPQMLASEYLSFTYGVTPLFADIKGIYEACIRLRDLPQLVKVRAAHTEERQVSASASNAAIYAVSHNRQILEFVRVTSIITGAVKVQSVGPVPPLMEVTGAQLRDFVPTIYELIPYSFLLDYVTNVGDVLNALSFSQSDLAWHSWSTIETGVQRITLTPRKGATYLGQPILGYSFLPCVAEVSTKKFVRSSAPLGLPSLAFRSPTLKQSFNTAVLAASRVLSLGSR
jgi:hypothetical protein